MRDTTHINKPRFRKAIDEAARLALDLPDEYDQLSPAELATLLEWIRLAIKPAKTAVIGSSYGIKHDFEDVTYLYVTNGQFKGAMLAAGYAPVNRGERNWRFRIRPTGKSSKSSSGSIYHIDHLAPEEREDLDALARAANRAQKRRYEAYRRHEQYPGWAS